MREETIALLKNLTNAHGVSGYEENIIEIFKKNVAGTFINDNLGSMYIEKIGKKMDLKLCYPHILMRLVLLLNQLLMMGI
ncbi:hypothetical protein OF820_08875 [Oceanotoga sp. DSM 15011]|uniref:hypothetical protein n=1 Tax=Oceanotoga sp. DSM 15011 TaxID=2984951 RepID=UPI0021F48701|nr:hypothetical protein [Oceanotoga sp. DSM 15011]UYO99185.1 hypothetical protein OF820_08875 [Oceanotoga sp. DSM 15011]